MTGWKFFEFQISVTSQFKKKCCNIWSCVLMTQAIMQGRETACVTFCQRGEALSWPKFHFHSNCPLFPPTFPLFEQANLIDYVSEVVLLFLTQPSARVEFWQTKTIGRGFHSLICPALVVATFYCRWSTWKEFFFSLIWRYGWDSKIPVP